MKKKVVYILSCFLIVYGASALELTVPEFHFDVMAGKPQDQDTFKIAQESSLNFRLLQGERFYSDLAIGMHISDILSFFHPHYQSRSFGQFAFADFSLNFPRLGGRYLSLSVFTGRHQSLTGSSYSFDFLKHGIHPVRAYDNDTAHWFLPAQARESVGLSFAGLIANSGYLGASFGWNAQIKEKQEYGVYMQGGAFSNIALTNVYFSVHLADGVREVSLDTALSVLFTLHDNFSLFTQAGLHKTNMRSTALKDELLNNLFGFFEPRVHLVHMNFDFTFFVSKIGNTSTPFPRAPLMKMFSGTAGDVYGGLNIFSGFGSLELDKLQGGFHVLVAANIKNMKDPAALLVAAVPFFTVNIGPCDLDFRVTVYPLAYTTPLSMFEGKIALKRTL